MAEAEGSGPEGEIAPMTGSASGADAGTEALLERLSLIEDQPLEQRAEAFQRVHDELRRVLDGGDGTASGG